MISAFLYVRLDSSSSSLPSSSLPSSLPSSFCFITKMYPFNPININQ